MATITVQMPDGPRSIEATGIRGTPFAIHPDASVSPWESGDPWTITHVPSGFGTIAGILYRNKSRARKMLLEWWDSLPPDIQNAFRIATDGESVAAILHPDSPAVMHIRRIARSLRRQ